MNLFDRGVGCALRIEPGPSGVLSREMLAYEVYSLSPQKLPSVTLGKITIQFMHRPLTRLGTLKGIAPHCKVRPFLGYLNKHLAKPEHKVYQAHWKVDGCELW